MRHDTVGPAQRLAGEIGKVRHLIPNPLRTAFSAAADGTARPELPEPPLDGSLVKRVSGEVRPVGFLEDHGSDCGPVCDCGGGAGCGIEAACDAVPGYPTEPICGLEVQALGCGAERRIGPGCGLEGCSDCDPGFGQQCRLEPDCACDACAQPCEVDRYPLFLPILRIKWCRFDFFAGTQAFKGPMNYASVSANSPNIRDGSGSFGFYQGFNEGRSLRRWLGMDLACQLGVRATQSNLSGAEFSNEDRHQVFVTGGFFRRVDYGLQYGLVVDYLNEDWYFQGDLTQLRGEFSWRFQRCDEAGFQYTSDLGSDSSNTVVRDATGALIGSDVSFEATDQYRFFYRWNLRNRGAWSAFAGWTDDSHGLLGSSLDLKLARRVGLQTGVTYLIPDSEIDSNEHRSEAWNLSLGLVFRPGGFSGTDRYGRPLFDVADNGTFIVRRR